MLEFGPYLVEIERAAAARECVLVVRCAGCNGHMRTPWGSMIRLHDESIEFYQANPAHLSEMIAGYAADCRHTCKESG